MTEENDAELPEWEIVYTFRAHVRARTMVQALEEAKPTFQTRHPVEVTEVRCSRNGPALKVEDTIVAPDLLEKRRIAILRRKAGEQCVWCWWRVPCAKDPNKGWVHIDPDEYKARGGRAMHVCEAPEVSDQILELEQAERE